MKEKLKKMSTDALLQRQGELKAIGQNPENRTSEELEKRTGIPMPEQVHRLKELPVRHTAVCDRDKMAEAILGE